MYSASTPVCYDISDISPVVEASASSKMDTWGHACFFAQKLSTAGNTTVGIFLQLCMTGIQTMFSTLGVEGVLGKLSKLHLSHFVALQFWY